MISGLRVRAIEVNKVLILLLLTILVFGCNEKKDILYSQRAYLIKYDYDTTKRKHVERFDLFFTKNADTIVKRYSNLYGIYPDLIFLKKDKEGILRKNEEEGVYKRFLYFDLKKKCLYTFTGIPCDYELGGEIYTRYDSIRLENRMLRIYDTLINSNVERRYVYRVSTIEYGYDIEINDKFELVKQTDFNGYSWHPLIPIPDSIAKWQDNR